VKRDEENAAPKPEVDAADMIQEPEQVEVKEEPIEEAPI
jgi:hypothetical protein